MTKTRPERKTHFPCSCFFAEDERCLIFVETKRSADYIGSLLSQKNFMSTTMHGDRSQKQRGEAVDQFTHGKCPVLVATSVAARGLDFPLIGYVVNFDLPDSSDFYVHRIGRTGARIRHVHWRTKMLD
jgi:superfamily II DNA/RNA helicase